MPQITVLKRAAGRVLIPATQRARAATEPYKELSSRVETILKMTSAAGGCIKKRRGDLYPVMSANGISISCPRFITTSETEVKDSLA